MQANTVKLREWVNERQGLSLSSYEALRSWSVTEPDKFWSCLWAYFDLHSQAPFAHAIAEPRMPGAVWFEGARVNYVEQVMRHAQDERLADTPAVIFRNERMQQEGKTIQIGWRELASRVAHIAGALQAMGVKEGDRVAAYLPNTPEALIAFLACASLGAIWSVCAPDMGVGTVQDRFRQIQPSVLLACDGSVYGGKVADRRPLITSLLQTLPSIAHLVLVPVLQASGGPEAPYVPDNWHGQFHQWAECEACPTQVAPQAVAFHHPLWVVYSSGTTGLPKPIVHGHGGVMLEMLKLHHCHLNLLPSWEANDRLHWYSSTGWVMWNLQMSALLQGTTICLYDGHPSFPQADTLWRFAHDLKVTLFGGGAAYYTGCMKAGVDPHALGLSEHIRTLGSTGSPLPPEGYAWGHAAVRQDVWWAVISGGTDIASAFLGGTPELPTIPGQMQARCLGADVQAWDENGQPLTDAVGELVCLQPMPSMPVKFWGDEGHKRYLDSYFDVYPGVWRHGDWLQITPSGGTIIYGRSDATLNRHGHRLGTSEVYRVVEAEPEVIDSLVVDIEFLGKPSYMPLFVVLKPGLDLDSALVQRLKQRIREGLSPRFVPDDIVQVEAIPRTLTGKKQELPVKKLMLGRDLADVVNKDACANPQAFDWYVDFAKARARQAG